jgi:hypothetical protein
VIQRFSVLERSVASMSRAACTMSAMVAPAGVPVTIEASSRLASITLRSSKLSGIAVSGWNAAASPSRGPTRWVAQDAAW